MNSSNGSLLVGSSDSIAKATTVVFILALVVGLIGHGLVILVVIGKDTRRTASDIFIMNLSVSDLTFLVLSLVINAHFYSGTHPYSAFYCKFVWPMLTTTFFASIFTLTSMAVHRCNGVLRPLKANFTAKQAMIWAGCVWMLSMLPILPLMIITEVNETHDYCLENWSAKSAKMYTVALLLLQYLIPLATITVAYFQIVRCLRQRKIPGTLLDKYGRAISQSSRQDSIQIIKIVAVIVVLFAVCLLPHELAGIMIFFGDNIRIEQGFVLLEYSSICLYVHSCLNPLVYGILTHQFRKDYKRYLLMLVCCCRYKKFVAYRGSYNRSRQSTVKSTLKKADSESKQPFANSFNLQEIRSRNVEENDGTESIEDTKI